MPSQYANHVQPHRTFHAAHPQPILKCSIPFPASPPSVTKQHVWPVHFLQVGLRLALQPGFLQEFISPLHLLCIYLGKMHLKHLTEVR